MGFLKRSAREPETSSEFFILLSKTTQCHQVFELKSSKKLYSIQKIKWSNKVKSQGLPEGQDIQCFSKSGELICCFNAMSFTLGQILQSYRLSSSTLFITYLSVSTRFLSYACLFFTVELASVNICVVDNSGHIHEKNTHQKTGTVIQ